MVDIFFFSYVTMCLVESQDISGIYTDKNLESRSQTHVHQMFYVIVYNVDNSCLRKNYQGRTHKTVLNGGVS